MSSSAEQASMLAPEELRVYIEGKYRRLYLLFAVNGGAFAIIQLFKKEPIKLAAPLVGNLKLWEIAVGVIIFTVAMIVDILFWGLNMGWGWGTPSKEPRPFDRLWLGPLIHLLLGVLICWAWCLAANFPLWSPLPAAIILVFVSCWELWTDKRCNIGRS